MPVNGSNFAFRGENRDESKLKSDGGFKPWQTQTVAQARQHLTRMAQDGTLFDIAYRWELSKNRDDGFFISTGTNPETAYDNYPHVYRCGINALQKRDWNMIPNAKNVGKVSLYTDGDTLAGSNQIAVIVELPGRREELLIMNPVPLDDTWIKRANGTWEKVV